MCGYLLVKRMLWNTQQYYYTVIHLIGYVFILVYDIASVYTETYHSSRYRRLYVISFFIIIQNIIQIKLKKKKCFVFYIIFFFCRHLQAHQEWVGKSEAMILRCICWKVCKWICQLNFFFCSSVPFAFIFFFKLIHMCLYYRKCVCISTHLTMYALYLLYMNICGGARDN